MVMKFPWSHTQYGQTSFEDDVNIDTLRQMTHEDYEEMANAARAAEDAYVTINNIEPGSGLVGAATGFGATPVPPMVPASAVQNAELCHVCGQPGVWKTTKTNKRVLECTNTNHKNDKGYAFAIRWA
jgi:hypothetical protein